MQNGNFWVEMRGDGRRVRGGNRGWKTGVVVREGEDWWGMAVEKMGTGREGLEIETKKNRRAKDAAPHHTTGSFFLSHARSRRIVWFRKASNPSSQSSQPTSHPASSSAHKTPSLSRLIRPVEADMQAARFPSLSQEQDFSPGCSGFGPCRRL